MLSDGRRKHLSDLFLILGTLSADVGGGEEDRIPVHRFYLACVCSILEEQANNSGTGGDANESRLQGSTTPVTQLPKFGLPSELEDPRVIVIKKDEKIFKIAYASAQGPKGPTRQSPLQRCHHMVMVTACAAASGSTLSTPNRIATHRFSDASWSMDPSPADSRAHQAEHLPRCHEVNPHPSVPSHPRLGFNGTFVTAHSLYEHS
ncbi:hypothetical protein JMJ77_0000892 [Colletotrichum scovillei]|uniref:Uncharacterized protein n=1 Tax=Colletotrichum scovillei TaxID=1209932 RepID=A0A9P7UHS3_9PEZI|nr:hypothetical protein JMJ77_0000892 [Colletotrichum scovillei]KAG7072107.1 hypothetical protein JMJ76_0004967 [Colletotrichum scovillei]KAG7080454.1 hypothetical protein JMJ78_0007548 [Colletotrichum scovillei]